VSNAETRIVTNSAFQVNSRKWQLIGMHELQLCDGIHFPRGSTCRHTTAPVSCSRPSHVSNTSLRTSTMATNFFPYFCKKNSSANKYKAVDQTRDRNKWSINQLNNFYFVCILESTQIRSRDCGNCCRGWPMRILMSPERKTALRIGSGASQRPRSLCSVPANIELELPGQCSPEFRTRGRAH